MMTDEQLIAKFLEMQEFPENLSDEQLDNTLADKQMQELVEQVAFAKRAFENEKLQTDSPSVDEEWAKFSANHLEKKEAKGRVYKIAASFVGALLASGIAIAAINIIRSESKPETQTPKTEQVLENTQAKSAASLTSDTIVTKPYIFDNVTLESMLTEIASAYNIDVEFHNEEARQLRFHFVWKREESLDHTVEKLNTFEAVGIIIENERLVVR